MQQLMPDWTAIVPKDNLEESYKFPFKYDKPGLYLTNTDTVFIQEDDDGEMLHIHCFNTTVDNIVICNVQPTQFDNRET